MTLEELQTFVDRSKEFQSQIWPAVTEAFDQPERVSGPEKALIISAVNEVLDAHNRRMAVFWDRLPTAVLLLLLMIAGVSIGLAAFQSSMGGHRPRWRMGALALVLASLMYVILDYDMVNRGLIQVDHSASLNW